MSAKKKIPLPPGVRALPSGNYQARYRGLDGRTHQRTFDSLMKAAAWVEHEKAVMALGAQVWSPPQQREGKKPATRLTVGEWMDQFHDSLEADGIRPTSMQRYRRSARTRITHIIETITDHPRLSATDKARMLPTAHIAAQLKNVTVTKLGKAEVYQWWYAIIATYPDTAPANHQAYLRLRAAMSEAVRREIIETNPVDIPAATKRPRPDREKKYLPTHREVAGIIAAAPANYRLAAAFCLRAGLRRGEALGVTVDDLSVRQIDGQQVYYLSVGQQIHRLEPEGQPVHCRLGELKTEASYRTIPLPADLNGMITEHLARHLRPARTQDTQWGGRQVQLLTTTSRGTMVSPNYFAEQFRQWVIQAGANPLIHPHSGRYYVNSTAAENGHTPKEIGDYLGESDLATVTDVYMQVRHGRLEELARGLRLPGRQSVEITV